MSGSENHLYMVSVPVGKECTYRFLVTKDTGDEKRGSFIAFEKKETQNGYNYHNYEWRVRREEESLMYIGSFSEPSKFTGAMTNFLNIYSDHYNITKKDSHPSTLNTFKFCNDFEIYGKVIGYLDSNKAFCRREENPKWDLPSNQSDCTHK